MAATLNRQRASGSGAQGGGGGYVIENSCRFNSADSPYLVRTWDTPTDANVWTFSTWIKRSKITTDQNIFGAMTGNGTLRWLAAGGLSFYIDNAAQTLNRITTQLFRDPLAWYHLVIAVETDLSSPILDRMIISVNGVRITSFTSSNSQSGTGFAINKASVAHRIGYSNYTAAYGDYYLAETVFVDGQQLDPTSFGEYDSNGNWVPIDPSELTFGNNGFHLKFDNANALGKDSSINDKSTTAYRYLRLDNTANQGSGSVSIGEWQLFEADGTEHPSSNMTSNSAPSPLVASASTANASYAAYGAFSGTNTGAANTGWIATSTAGYLQIDLGAGNEIVLDNYSITEGAGTATDNGPKTWTIEGSNTGDFTGEEEVLDTIVNEPIFSANEVRNFPMLGSGNHFSTSGISADDQMSDSPTDSADDDIGNYCTMSPIFGLASAVYSNGNLTVDADDDSAWGTTFASSGKYYFEIKQTATHNANLIGVAQDTGFKHAKGGSYAGSGGHADNANAYGFYSTTGTSKKVDQAGTTTTYGGNATASGTVLQCALDLDNGLIWFGWNDANWIDPAGAASSATVKASMEAGESTYAAFTGITGSFAPWHFNANGVSCDFYFGANGFNHTPPTGFSPWNTSALPAPAVKDPSEGFVIVEDAEANIAATLATARSGWTDFIDFIKDKSSTDSWIVRFSDDSTNHMKFDTNAAASTFPTLSGSNVHVGYSLRVGAAYGVFTDSVSHTNGTDTDTAHGLGSNNKWCLAKLESTTGSWYHKHPANSASKNNTIDVSGAEGTTFYVDVDGTNVTIQSAAPTGTYRVWVLEETSGLISLPQYTGNGSADGPYVSFGHTPHWLWRWGISVADNYYTNNAVTSPYNPTNHRFILDVAQAAGTDADIDILAGGYKVRQTTPNTSGTVYGCISFGSRPFGGLGVSQARSR